jgi:hypothetical protein
MKTAILVLSQLAVLGVTVRLLWMQRVSVILSTSLLFYVFLWQTFPITMRVFFADALDLPGLVEQDAYVTYAIIESVTLLATFICIAVVEPLCRFRLVRLSSLLVSPKMALTLCVIGLSVTLMLLVLFRELGGTYLERNAFAVSGAGTAEFSNLGTLAVLQDITLAFAYVCLLEKWPRLKDSILLYVIILIWLILAHVPNIQMGGRVALILPLLLLLLRGRVFAWSFKKMGAIAGLGIVLTLFIGSFVGLVITDSRAYSVLAVNEIASASTHRVTSSAPRTLAKTVIVEAVTKFDSISWGAALVDLDGYGVAGWTPYLGAATALVPRQLFPAKPVPGSINGSYEGHPTRLIAARMGFDFASGNVQVSPAAISIWQFGYGGLLLCVLSNVLCLLFVNSLLLSPSLLSKSLGVYMIGLPVLYPLFSSPDVVLMNLQRVALIILVIRIVYWFAFEMER